MKRLLIVLIAVLLPLQLVWGAAAAYCGHEAKQATHVGHHTHVHEAEAKKVADSKPQLADMDCQACHAGSVAALPVVVSPPPLAVAATAPLMLADLRRPSAPQRAPDRPQWPRLV